MKDKLPDYSGYLTEEERIAKEEEGWAETEFYKRNAENIMIASRKFKLGDSFSLLELGCGSGWVPTVLPDSIAYLGVDNNPTLVEMAQHKNNRRRKFIQFDIREFSPSQLQRLTGKLRSDLVCSFAVLKHFGLHEWEKIFQKMLRLGVFGVFNIQLTLKEVFDDGVDYHHTWVSRNMVEKCVEAEGKKIVGSEILWSGELGIDAIFYTGEKL